MHRRPILASIQILRALAAMLVMIGHATIELPRLHGWTGGIGWTFNYGFGVDVFFVISGFVMAHASSDLFGQAGAPRAFMLARLSRIAPLYWLLTSLVLAIDLALPSIMNMPQPTPASIAGSFLFVPVADSAGLVQPLLAVGWTINYEMFFYSLFAICLLLPRALGAATLLVVLLSLSVAGSAPASAHLPVALRFWASPLLLEFAAGLLLGLSYDRLQQIGRIASAGLILTGACLFAASNLLPDDTSRLLRDAPAAVALVAGAAATRGRDTSHAAICRLLLVVGGASYSLYLTHMFMVRAVRLLWNAIRLPPDPLLFCASVAIVAVPVAVAVAYGVELPLHHAMKRRIGWFSRQKYSRQPDIASR